MVSLLAYGCNHLRLRPSGVNCSSLHWHDSITLVRPCLMNELFYRPVDMVLGVTEATVHFITRLDPPLVELWSGVSIQLNRQSISGLKLLSIYADKVPLTITVMGIQHCTEGYLPHRTDYPPSRTQDTSPLQSWYPPYTSWYPLSLNICRGTYGILNPNHPPPCCEQPPHGNLSILHWT